MMKVMTELGPCAEVVKETMQECFLLMAAGVK